MPALKVGAECTKGRMKLLGLIEMGDDYCRRVLSRRCSADLSI